MTARSKPVDRAQKRRPPRRVVLAAGMIVVVAAAYLVTREWSRTVAATRLPDLPTMTGLPPALVEHVVGADRAARRSPTSPAAVGGLGMAYHADLFYEQASAAYQLAAELDPANWRWIYYRALIHFERGDAMAASEALAAVVAHEPGFALAWWRLGETAFKQGRYQDAETAYSQAVSTALASDRSEILAYARTGHARAALHRGDAPAAERMLDRVIESDARFGPAQRVMAEVLRAQGRDVEAQRHADRAASLRAYAAPEDPLVNALAAMSRSSVFLLRHAASLDLNGDGTRREHVVRQALQADPDNPDVIYEMGSLLQQLRRPADALPYFARHLEVSRNDPQTLVQIGKTYGDLGRLDEAETALRRALDVGDDAVGFYNLGHVLERRERLVEAESSYRRAIALNPGLASARNNLGVLLARGGRLDEATTHLL